MTNRIAPKFQIGYAVVMVKDIQFICVWLAAVYFAGPTIAQEISFNRDIRPILSDRCYFCHGFDENHREADLRLDVRDDAAYVWDVDSPDDSEMMNRITSDDPDEVMPPPAAHKKAITREEVDLIRRWIEQGAKYESHWAFVNPVRPQTQANNTADVIDEFVARQHKNKKLKFAAPAIPTKWLRRAALDLTGTPPTLAELDAFAAAVNDRGDAAFEEAVDRLLASPRYGERMTLDWLDVARYADTNGFQFDGYRMNWPWRDWVIRAFNDNMPFDQFTIEQLAGDLLENPTEDQLVATAFNRNNMINAEGGSIREENLAKISFDRVETTGTTWLGLTVGCCQCHDHKFDPLKQKDYYSLVSFFNQTSETGLASKKLNVKPPGRKFSKGYQIDQPFISVGDEKVRKQLAGASKKIAAARKELESNREEYVAGARQWIQEMRDDPEVSAKRIEPSEYVARYINSADLDNPKEEGFRQLISFYLKREEPWKTLQQKINKEVSKESALQESLPLVMVMRDDKPRDTFVMLRGNYESLGEKVSPSTPDFLPSLPDPKSDQKTNRLTLAKWLVSAEQPLTSRVTVNRYWQLMFGRGLVSTPDDFGLQGALPSHPELLDWLAVEFRDSGWDVKALLKGIVLSRTYRQSAITDAAGHKNDAANQWLARGPRLRLDSRLLRDQALSLSGLLNPEIGGPPVFPYQPDGIWEAFSLGKNHYMRDDGESLYRRSMYTVWRRVVAPANFFDVQSRQSCSVTLRRTSTPLHALTTLNDITYIESARVWSAALANIPDDETRLSRLFFAATARSLDANELASLTKSLGKARKRFEADPEAARKLIAMGESELTSDLPASEHAAWTTMCLMILNLDETLCK